MKEEDEIKEEREEHFGLICFFTDFQPFGVYGIYYQW